MFAILVQVGEHFFIPYEPTSDGEGTTDRQCIYPSPALAEQVVKIIKEKRPKPYRQIRIVTFAEALGKLPQHLKLHEHAALMKAAASYLSTNTTQGV